MAGKKNKNKKNAEAAGGQPQQQQQNSQVGQSISHGGQSQQQQSGMSGPPPGFSTTSQASTSQQQPFQWGASPLQWGPPPQQQRQPTPQQQPQRQPTPQQTPQQPQSAWGPPKDQQQQSALSQDERQQTQLTKNQQQQRPKGQGGSKNKYPKKIVEPAPAPPAEQAPGPSSAGSDIENLQGQMQQIKMSPTKILSTIESSPDGRVYEGSRGKKCVLEVNYLKIAVNKLIPKAFHYDVSFNPDIPKKMLPKALDELMRTYFPKVLFAFDGRASFYTNQLLVVKDVVLDGEFEREVEAVLGDRRKNFKVKVKFAAEVDLSVLRSYRDPKFQLNDKPMRAIQCLDVILRTVFKQMTFDNRAVAVGRALYFAESGKPIDLGEGMELWLGLFQSAVLGRQSLYLNVDVAHKAFPSSVSLLNLLSSFSRDGKIPETLDLRTQAKLSEYLKMLSIGYRLNINEPPKTFGFNKLVDSARTAIFVNDKNEKMSVLNYFKNVKRINLRYPDLPCLHVGSKIRNIYLPIELCEIPAGQATNKKCTPNAVAAMIKYSATSTDERKAKIRNLLNKIDYAKDKSEIKGFGIDVDTKFQNVEGRVIDPPQIKYKGGSVRPAKGVWNGSKFLETQTESIKWGIVNCDERTSKQTVDVMAENILIQSRKQGMDLTDYTSDDYYQFNFFKQGKVDDIVKVLESFAKYKYKLVFVIIVDMNDCYAKVKQAAELKVGILTQCIKANTIYRMGNPRANPMMTIGNIMLKVNAKLNGVNHEVIETSYQGFNKTNSGVMFVGGDVTHPSPDQRDIPSVVGVAASYDSIGFRYQCAWRLQDPKKEMIVDLENILVEHLKFYKAKNKILPGKIMYYRDGVSDGQFGEVLNVEMTAIRAALKRMYGTQPAALVTFVVVQKRHHTRFFPTKPEFSDGKNKNIMPGTVVDKDIVHPFQYQFFLASHAAIQGVTKPSKYCVLVNESKIQPDDLQAITYDLCHLFTRCNRSVSYPAPTYYAHLVAARGKSYTLGSRLNMNTLQHEYNTRVIKENITNNCPMFFV